MTLCGGALALSVGSPVVCRYRKRHVLMCVSARVWGAHVCTSLRKLKVDIRNLQLLFHLKWDTVSQLHSYVNLACPLSPQFPFSTLCVLWSYPVSHYYLECLWVLGIWTLVLIVRWQVIWPLIYLSSPHFHILLQVFQSLWLISVAYLFSSLVDEQTSFQFLLNSKSFQEMSQAFFISLSGPHYCSLWVMGTQHVCIEPNRTRSISLNLLFLTL